MSLYGVMRTGVSGMSAQSNKLSTVSDNIANVNTTGYKRASTEFSSLILKSGHKPNHAEWHRHLGHAQVYRPASTLAVSVIYHLTDVEEHGGTLRRGPRKR